MNSIGVQNAKDRNALVTRLHDSKGDLDAVIEVYNAKLAELFALVQEALEVYNATIWDAQSFRTDLVSELEGYRDERSDKWQESDRGQAFEDWIQEWENLDLDEVTIDEPEPLETPDVCHADDLDACAGDFEE